jgi:hypothetical protein
MQRSCDHAKRLRLDDTSIKSFLVKAAEGSCVNDRKKS